MVTAKAASMTSLLPSLSLASLEERRQLRRRRRDTGEYFSVRCGFEGRKWKIDDTLSDGEKLLSSLLSRNVFLFPSGVTTGGVEYASKDICLLCMLYPVLLFCERFQCGRKATFYFYFFQSDLHIIIRGFTPAIKMHKVWCHCCLFGLIQYFICFPRKTRHIRRESFRIQRISHVFDEVWRFGIGFRQ